jgi:hypothetical protein
VGETVSLIFFILYMKPDGTIFKYSFQETKVFIFCKLCSANNSFVKLKDKTWQCTVCKLSNLNFLNGAHGILKSF